MKRFSLKYQLLVLTVVALGVWGAAVDLPFVFKAGDVISAEQMNQTLSALNNGKQERVEGTCAAGSSIRSIGADGTVACEVDDIGSGAGDAGVDAINGMTGAVTLQAGENITIDDTTAGQLRISSSSGGTNTNAHDHFGQTWTGAGDRGLTIINTRVDTAGTSTILGRSGAGSNIDIGPDLAGVWGDGERGAGVWGTNVQGPGVFGVSLEDAGVYGFSPSNIGVSGKSTGGQGVLGQSSSASGVGVHGLTGTATGVAPGFGAGLWGESSTDSYGVFAYSAANISLYAQNASLTAIKGQSSSNNGVWGESSTGTGVLGRTASSGRSGVRGETVGAALGYGVSGSSASGVGVYGESTNNAGVFGKSTNNNAAFFTGGAGGTGSCSYNGGAGWSCTSDRNAKENFRSVDVVQVLEQLSAMPVTTWSMKGDAKATPHLGPTAQDFYIAFGLGDSDTAINTVDAQGVALAAIQGLHQLVQNQQAHIESLEARLEELE